MKYISSTVNITCLEFNIVRHIKRCRKVVDRKKQVKKNRIYKQINCLLITRKSFSTSTSGKTTEWFTRILRRRLLTKGDPKKEAKINGCMPCSSTSQIQRKCFRMNICVIVKAV